MTSKQLEKIVTKSRFKKFLQEHPERTFKRGDCTFCPIARFVGFFLPKGWEVAVDEESISIETFDQTRWASITTPTWASNFIEKVDAKKGTVRAKVCAAYI